MPPWRRHREEGGGEIEGTEVDWIGPPEADCSRAVANITRRSDMALT